MRKRFDPQLGLGRLPISETEIPVKSRDAFPALLAALKEIFAKPSYNEEVFFILEEALLKGKNNKTGRPGMDLWQLFVLAQVRLCLNISYDRLHYMANYDTLLRQIMGVETDSGFEKVRFEYQNILDNVSLLDDETVRQLNEVIVRFGHDVFKKKGTEALHCVGSRLKTDSFVVESNVHFPTDYNLLWDCARKCLDVIAYFLKKHPDLPGWRKIKNWRREIKSLMRQLGKASRVGGKRKEERVKKAAEAYLAKTNTLLQKMRLSQEDLPLSETIDMSKCIALEKFMALLEKHIELVNRRLIQTEKIPHEEKIFSVFEEYTEWVKKGKLHPNVELGKKLAVTTDQYNLIVDYQVMEHEADADIVLSLADRVLDKYKVFSWSYDRGFFNKEHKELLQLFVPQVIMPKKGKRNQCEEQQESQRSFMRLKNKHNAIESNINELEHRGLHRCPDRGLGHFKRYIGLGVCAYNLHRIGKRLIMQQRQEEKKQELCA